MTNQAVVQGKTVITAQVPRALDYRLRLATVERRLSSKSESIRQAVEEWLERVPCPQCGGPTFADPQRPGARFCPACGEAVLFDPKAGKTTDTGAARQHKGVVTTNAS